MNIKWSKNKQLIVNSKLYKKLITSPASKDLLREDEEMKGRIAKIELVKGDQICEKSSKFLGVVKTIEQAREGYRFIRIVYSEASHMVCAF